MVLLQFLCFNIYDSIYNYYAPCISFQIIEREKRVAFIGISNWALDPAKMNRGVMVTRDDPGLDELKLSAKGICSNREDDPVRERLQDYFDPLSKAYKDICKRQERQFFGLRDFYRYVIKSTTINTYSEWILSDMSFSSSPKQTLVTYV